jgi:predicted secreted protein|tara:strand:+ start:629 stop:928 length:300 start_codon:yes stop_codon:yes gene_type:complete
MTYQVKLELVAKNDTDSGGSNTFKDNESGAACREIYNQYVTNKWITNFSIDSSSSTIKQQTINFDSAGRWDLYLTKMKEHSPSSEAHNFIATVISEQDV